MANHNAPLQTVVGCTAESLGALERLLREHKLDFRRLPVPRPFHTALMEAVKEPFRRALESIPLEPPRVPMLSCVTNRYVADPQEIRDNLAIQMTRRV